MLRGKEYYVVSESTSVSAGYFKLETYIQLYKPPLDADGKPKKGPAVREFYIPPENPNYSKQAGKCRLLDGSKQSTYYTVSESGERGDKYKYDSIKRSVTECQ